jgi:hypothetical protein
MTAPRLSPVVDSVAKMLPQTQNNPSILPSQEASAPQPGRIARWAASRRLRVAGLTLYYLAVIAALIVLYGRGNFSTPRFIYQGF